MRASAPTEPRCMQRSYRRRSPEHDAGSAPLSCPPPPYVASAAPDDPSSEPMGQPDRAVRGRSHRWMQRRGLTSVRTPVLDSSPRRGEPDRRS